MSPGLSLFSSVKARVLWRSRLLKDLWIELYGSQKSWGERLKAFTKSSTWPKGKLLISMNQKKKDFLLLERKDFWQLSKLPLQESQLLSKKNTPAIMFHLTSKVTSWPNNLGKKEKNKETNVEEVKTEEEKEENEEKEEKEGNEVITEEKEETTEEETEKEDNPEKVVKIDQDVTIKKEVVKEEEAEIIATDEKNHLKFLHNIKDKQLK
jgi:hypothetical protein